MKTKTAKVSAERGHKALRRYSVRKSVPRLITMADARNMFDRGEGRIFIVPHGADMLPEDQYNTDRLKRSYIWDDWFRHIDPHVVATIRNQHNNRLWAVWMAIIDHAKRQVGYDYEKRNLRCQSRHLDFYYFTDAEVQDIEVDVLPEERYELRRSNETGQLYLNRFVLRKKPKEDTNEEAVTSKTKKRTRPTRKKA